MTELPPDSTEKTDEEGPKLVPGADELIAAIPLLDTPPTTSPWLSTVKIDGISSGGEGQPLPPGQVVKLGTPGALKKTDGELNTGDGGTTAVQPLALVKDTTTTTTTTTSSDTTTPVSKIAGSGDVTKTFTPLTKSTDTTTAEAFTDTTATGGVVTTKSTNFEKALSDPIAPVTFGDKGLTAAKVTTTTTTTDYDAGGEVKKLASTDFETRKGFTADGTTAVPLVNTEKVVSGDGKSTDLVTTDYTKLAKGDYTATDFSKVSKGDYTATDFSKVSKGEYTPLKGDYYATDLKAPLPASGETKIVPTEGKVIPTEVVPTYEKVTASDKLVVDKPVSPEKVAWDPLSEKLAKYYGETPAVDQTAYKPVKEGGEMLALGDKYKPTTEAEMLLAKYGKLPETTTEPTTPLVAKVLPTEPVKEQVALVAHYPTATVPETTVTRTEALTPKLDLHDTHVLTLTPATTTAKLDVQTTLALSNDRGGGPQPLTQGQPTGTQPVSHIQPTEVRLASLPVPSVTNVTPTLAPSHGLEIRTPGPTVLALASVSGGRGDFVALSLVTTGRTNAPLGGGDAAVPRTGLPGATGVRGLDILARTSGPDAGSAGILGARGMLEARLLGIDPSRLAGGDGRGLGGTTGLTGAGGREGRDGRIGMSGVPGMPGIVGAGGIIIPYTVAGGRSYTDIVNNSVRLPLTPESVRPGEPGFVVDRTTGKVTTIKDGDAGVTGKGLPTYTALFPLYVWETVMVNGKPMRVLRKRMVKVDRALPGTELLIGALLAMAAVKKADGGAEAARSEADDQSTSSDHLQKEGAPKQLRRRSMQVGIGDDLVRIGEEKYGAGMIGWLIADINLASIKETWDDGKRIIELKNRQVIELPNQDDVEEFMAGRPKHADPAKLVTLVVETHIDRDLVDRALSTVIGAAPLAKEPVATTVAAKNESGTAADHANPERSPTLDRMRKALDDLKSFVSEQPKR